MNNEPKIVVIDDLPPEDIAMLQALYSRDPGSVTEHLEKVKRAGSGKFMSQYYVNYNHKSIADCGDTTIFVEGISMLAAKAIQDNPLYSGQESSTRYIDFALQPINDPINTPESRDIQKRWMAFYFQSKDALTAHLRGVYPRKEGEGMVAYEGAIKARSFDILRGFLPAGATTNVAWHTNLRQAYDKLANLTVHPDEIIANIGMEIAHRLHARYPNSGFGRLLNTEYTAERDYRRQCMSTYAYTDDRSWNHPHDAVLFSGQLSTYGLRANDNALTTRPRGVELPRALMGLGDLFSNFLLDYGSYRDLQRHRNGFIPMPLLTTKLGFVPWYLYQMPDDMASKATDLINHQRAAIDRLPGGPHAKQYYTAMGFKVACAVKQDLPAFVYRMETRSSKTVHPTLRRVVLEEIKAFRELYPGITLHVDTDPDDWTVRRGTQTIEARTPG